MSSAVEHSLHGNGEAGMAIMVAVHSLLRDTACRANLLAVVGWTLTPINVMQKEN